MATEPLDYAFRLTCTACRFTVIGTAVGLINSSVMSHPHDMTVHPLTAEELQSAEIGVMKCEGCEKQGEPERGVTFFMCPDCCAELAHCLEGSR